MLKILYILTILFSAQWLTAQIIYPSTDFAVAGDTFRISKAKTDSLQYYDFQAAGAGYNWDFSTLSPQSQYIDQYTTANSSGYRLSFIASCIAAGGGTVSCNTQWNGLSNLAHLLPDSLVFGAFKFTNQVELYDKTTGLLSLNALGMSFGFDNIIYPVAVKYMQADTVYHFPLAYGNRDSCTSSYSINLAAIGINFDYKVTARRINNVEGWGPLTTPYGSFSSTLKLSTVIYNFDTMVYNNAIIPIPPDTTITYSWFAATKMRPVLVANGSLINGTVHYSDIEYPDTLRCLMPLAVFSYSPLVPYFDSATQSAEVTFNNTSANANIFQWDFGDLPAGISNSSNATDPVHAFSSPGVYHVTLVACNSACSPSRCDTLILPVTVFDSTKVQANFTWFPLQPCTADTVKYTNTSLNATTLQWNFGDGSFSSLPNPQKVYNVAGSYQVTLVAGGNGHTDTAIQLITIGAAPMAVTIPAGNIMLCNGDTILLVASGGGNIYKWSNGAIGDSIRANRNGNYSVQAYNNCGSSLSQPVDITLVSLLAPGVNIAAWPGDTVCAHTSLNFNASASNGGSAPVYYWIKNGAPVGTGQPAYEDANPVNGDSVWCVLTSSASCAAPATVYSNKVYPVVKPLAAYSYLHVICPGSSYYFNGASISSQGIYTDTLTLISGCDSIVTLTLNVSPGSSPVIAVTGSDTLTTGAFSTYQWLIGDSVIENATGRQYIAMQSGAYSVSVTNTDGCADTSAAVNIIYSSVYNTTAHSNIAVFPNPVSGLLHLSISGLGDDAIHIKLYDLTGRLLISATGENTAGKFMGLLRMEDMPGGVYYLEIKSGAFDQTEKIVVAK